ncbi:hypothetical protein LX32DRAFT_188173 [Colletotrichum zoysiae]|uniref:Uncharacterized protein n=1 Tax=Colletotrichum zoysiae TaxID=1216348 RepID=A0AAD9H763_9PEZI|nr:hypothetical protein LX32DRAFT_188173 [Colletotrichum zoysiae]
MGALWRGIANVRHTLWCEGFEFPFWEWQQQQTCAGASEWRPTRVEQIVGIAHGLSHCLLGSAAIQNEKKEKKVYHIHGVSFSGADVSGILGFGGGIVHIFFIGGSL